MITEPLVVVVVSVSLFVVVSQWWLARTFPTAIGDADGDDATLDQ